MTIIQLYDIYNEIKNTKHKPHIDPVYYNHEFVLQTNRYKIKAEERRVPYIKCEYIFTALDKKSNKTISADGFLARMLFLQISRKVKQK